MSDPRHAGAGRRCPICAKPATARHRPFCSARCRLIDLGRWLNDEYRISTEESSEDLPREERED